MQSAADLGTPYLVLWHERFLGRPYATHRDSVREPSELPGNQRAERMQGFEQAPGFIVPNAFTPPRSLR